MESGVRKILPRVQPSGAERESDAAGEALRNGNGVVEVARPDKSTAWQQPMEDERAPKRKRHHVDESRPRSHTLPSLRQLLPVGTHPHGPDHDRAGPVRLVRTGKSSYSQQGPFKFLAPRPNREFPASIFSDPRELSFAQVEPELMEVFKHAWYLRHYVRAKTLAGEHWNDHIYCNDVYGIENILYTWICRYEPGNLQYPASILYKQCLWIFFNRSIQTSQSTAAFRHIVDDGLHFLRTFENELGPTGDRSVLLVPIFLLGSTSFYAGQRAEIWTSLDRLDPSYSIDAVHHAARSLERIWEMMDDGRATVTWDWEKFQAHEYTMATADRSLIELLWDPLAPPPQARVRSPETYDFDPSRFRAAPPPVPPPPPPPEPARSQREETDMYSPPDARSPRTHHSTASVDAESIRVEVNPENTAGHIEIAAGPRPFLAPPPPSANVHSNDIIQVLQRKSTKSKSSVPPCPTCGKELKNPSDAQKHHLQHSKPFRCREPGCTRTQGFATENDLQRHRKSVHGASPRIGNKIGYVCAACPDPSDGTTRKWWPRLDNFKAHIRRKHNEAEEEHLIQLSASARRPEDAYSEGYQSSTLRTPDERRYQQNLRSSRSVENGTPQDDSQSVSPTKGPGNEDTGGESNPTQGEGDYSDEQDRLPKSESDLSTPDAMEVSPTGERGE